MEPVRWDRDPERVVVADSAIREQAQCHTGRILPMVQVRTGDFRMGDILMEVTPSGQAMAQAVEDSHVEAEEDAPMAAAEAGAGKNIRSLDK